MDVALGKQREAKPCVEAAAITDTPKASSDQYQRWSLAVCVNSDPLDPEARVTSRHDGLVLVDAVMKKPSYRFLVEQKECGSGHNLCTCLQEMNRSVRGTLKLDWRSLELIPRDS